MKTSVVVFLSPPGVEIGMIHFPICEVVLKIDRQSSHEVTQYHELVYKSRIFELVIDLEMFEIFKIYGNFFVRFWKSSKEFNSKQCFLKLFFFISYVFLAASSHKVNLITTLLLGHSRLARLFDIFFQYWWCYLCFLPTLSPSYYLVGIWDPLSRVLQHFQHKPREWRSFCGRQTRSMYL